MLMVDWNVPFLVHMVKYSSEGHWEEMFSFDYSVYNIWFKDTHSWNIILQTKVVYTHWIFHLIKCRYMGSKVKMQYFNAFAVLLSTWNSNPFLTLQECKTRKFPCPEYPISGCKVALLICGFEISHPDERFNLLQLLVSVCMLYLWGHFTSHTYPFVFQRVLSLPHFLVSASFIRLNTEFLTWKSTTVDATFLLPFPLLSLTELSCSVC